MQRAGYEMYEPAKQKNPRKMTPFFSHIRKLSNLSSPKLTIPNGVEDDSVSEFKSPGIV